MTTTRNPEVWVLEKPSFSARKCAFRWTPRQRSPIGAGLNPCPILLLLVSTFSVAEEKVEWSYDVLDPPKGVFSESWMEIYLGENKVGYGRETLSRKGDTVTSRSQHRMEFGRGPLTLSLSSELTSRESVQGKAKSFRYSSKQGLIPLIVTGKIEGDTIRLKSRQAKVTRVWEKEWNHQALMTWGYTREVWLRKFKPGTTYELLIYSPDTHLNESLPMEISIGEEELVTIRDRERTLIRFTTNMRFGLGEVTTLSWMTTNGDILKSEVEFGGFKLSMHTVDQKTALAEFVPTDLFDFSLLSVDTEIPKDAKSVTYSIRFPKDSSRQIQWPNTAYQFIESVGPQEVKVRVVRADHQALGRERSRNSVSVAGSTVESDPDAVEFGAYLEGSSMINIEDPLLIDLSKRVVDGSDGVVGLADELRKFVSGHVSSKSLQVGFATASEVARQKSGDCTEHAVLLTALGRIRNLPSRIATGIAYLPKFMGKENVFGFHMWTQFFLKDRWVDFDAALGESVCSPTRIAFFVSSLDEDGMIDASLSLMDILGEIEIEVVEVEGVNSKQFDGRSRLRSTMRERRHDDSSVGHLNRYLESTVQGVPKTKKTTKWVGIFVFVSGLCL